MAEPASISQGIAARYATALFELAKEAGALPALEADCAALSDAVTVSPELQDTLGSPVVSRFDHAGIMAALSDKLALSNLTRNTLSLMADKRRLFVLPQMLREVQTLLATEKGEVTAEVTAATKLTAAQSKALAAALKASVGKTVKLNTTVDETLIGGLIVKLGSTMIDTSVKSKLASLQNAMKEVG